MLHLRGGSSSSPSRFSNTQPCILFFAALPKIDSKCSLMRYLRPPGRTSDALSARVRRRRLNSSCSRRSLPPSYPAFSNQRSSLRSATGRKTRPKPEMPYDPWPRTLTANSRVCSVYFFQKLDLPGIPRRGLVGFGARAARPAAGGKNYGSKRISTSPPRPLEKIPGTSEIRNAVAQLDALEAQARQSPSPYSVNRPCGATGTSRWTRKVGLRFGSKLRQKKIPGRDGRGGTGNSSDSRPVPRDAANMFRVANAQHCLF